MGKGTQAWQDVGFVVFGNEPLLPAKIEQQIAMAMPQFEVNVDSFEDYEEALDHCKRQASIGLIFVHEDCGQHKIESVFKNLARPCEATGWPVLGVVIRKSAEVDSIHALKAMKEQKSIIGYYSEKDFESASSINQIFETLWKSYIATLEEKLIPDALQYTLRSVVESNCPAEECVFIDRLNEVLTAPLNLSWKEAFQVRWSYLVDEAAKVNPSVLAPHQALQKLIKSNRIEKNLDAFTLLEITSSKDGLASRAVDVSKKILTAVRRSNLENLLQEARTESRPGRPGLLRTVAAQSNVILNIYHDTYQSSSNTGKVAA
jgi:hypothetical protein